MSLNYMCTLPILPGEAITGALFTAVKSLESAWCAFKSTSSRYFSFSLSWN